MQMHVQIWRKSSLKRRILLASTVVKRVILLLGVQTEIRKGASGKSFVIDARRLDIMLQIARKDQGGKFTNRQVLNFKCLVVSVAKMTTQAQFVLIMRRIAKVRILPAQSAEAKDILLRIAQILSQSLQTDLQSAINVERTIIHQIVKM